MEITCVKYTSNPETGRKVRVGTLSWKRLATKYYMIDRTFTDQVIPDSRALTVDRKSAFMVRDGKVRKASKAYKWVVHPAGIKRYIIEGSKAWNERYLEYEWIVHEFGKRRQLPEFMNTVKKRRETWRNKFFTLFDCKVSEGRFSDVIQSSLGYALTYHHTVDENMYKEWMNEKRTKKKFHIHKNKDERRLWVWLSDEKNEDKVELLNLMNDETGEFNEVAKKYIINGMRDYPQCFITIMAYNLMWTLDGKPRYSISLMIDWVTFASFTKITSMNGRRIIWSGTEMPCKNRRPSEVVIFTMDDRFPYRDVPTMDIRRIQTPNTFDPWTISFQFQYWWQPAPTMISHSGKLWWTQDHCKS